MYPTWLAGGTVTGHESPETEGFAEISTEERPQDGAPVSAAWMQFWHPYEY